MKFSGQKFRERKQGKLFARMLMTTHPKPRIFKYYFRNGNVKIFHVHWDFSSCCRRWRWIFRAAAPPSLVYTQPEATLLHHRWVLCCKYRDVGSNTAHRGFALWIRVEVWLFDGRGWPVVFMPVHWSTWAPVCLHPKTFWSIPWDVPRRWTPRPQTLVLSTPLPNLLHTERGASNHEL